MSTLIFYDKTEGQVKKKIIKRKIQYISRLLLRGFAFPFVILFKFLKYISSNLYNYLYPKRVKINKITFRLIIIYSIIYSILNVVLYFFDKPLIVKSLIMIPILLSSFYVIRLVLRLYHLFFGENVILDFNLIYSREYIVTKLPKLLKVFGETGAGKDTFVAGCCSVLSEDYRIRTEEDLIRIRDLLFCINFEELDSDLDINKNAFLTNNKEKIERNFKKMADQRKMYLKKYYIIHKKLKPKNFYQDYLNFKEDPYNYSTDYAIGSRVNRKHFIQVIIDEYIQWYIRLNVEKNFLMVNQPFIEDPERRLMAKKFSLRFLKLKRIDKEVYDKKTRKKTIIKEKVFFPWKDRLIVAETECGSWYMNRDKAADAEMLKSGIRDFKAYSRHFVNDFRWFQVDQAPERTSKLFRELDHSYVAVLNRMTVEGGKKRNLILNLLVKYYSFRINRIEHKTNINDMKREKASIKIDDIKELYYSSSKQKYKRQLSRLERKYRIKSLPIKHHKFTYKMAIAKQQIDKNKKEGFIIETVCISKNPNSPIEFSITPIKDILQSEKKHITFVTNLIFRMSDCERYDTRYMKNLADEKSKETIINYNDIPRWNPNFKMDKKDVIWMGYLSAKEQYGISDKDMEDMNYNEAYKEHIIAEKISS